jgi:hypothetical protein
MATATFSHRPSINRVPALIAALAICGVLGAISILVPPFMENDTGYGFLAWRGTLLGTANSVITANPANIAQDSVEFLTWFSPGQYLIPGAISLIGVPIGIAITLTVALSMLACLIGWVMVVKVFAPRTGLALLVVLLIGSFRYSTSEFGLYHGGEILVQAATPWLILVGWRVPEIDAVRAALVATVAVFLAFLAKLTGIIVVAAALMAGSLVSLAFDRRITRGMIGGAVGALAALVIIYVTFLSRGATSASHTSWSLPFGRITISPLVPWVAGLSWVDMMGRNVFGYTYFLAIPIQYVALIVPPAVLVISLVWFWRPLTISERKLRSFSMWFYGLVLAVLILLYIHGADIAVEERYFRPAGTLLFACALISALAAGTPRWMRHSFLALCVVMALYGVASFSHRAWNASNGQSLDRTSWTNQEIFDAGAIRFARQQFDLEGRNALFVLPASQLALTLPLRARILVTGLNWEPLSHVLSVRYAGRVPGHVFVLLPNTIFGLANGMLDMSKVRTFLSTFTDYAPDAWSSKSFANMTVFFQ